MKILIKLFLISLIFSNCQEKIEKDCLICRLEGDWIAKEADEVMIIYQDKIVEDRPFLVKHFESFRIVEDEIIIDTICYRFTEGLKSYEYGVRYKIQYLELDTLRLLRYRINRESEAEKVEYLRLKRLNKYKFEKLSLSSSPCMGHCPIFQIEIDSEGGFNYQGRNNVEKEGNYQGKLKKEGLELLQNLIDQIEWGDQIGEHWEGGSDGQYFQIEMIDKKGIEYKILTNSWKLKAINILIFKVFMLIEKSEMEKVDKEAEFSTDLKRIKKQHGT